MQFGPRLLPSRQAVPTHLWACCLVVYLAGAILPGLLYADAGDDEFKFAVGLYKQSRWSLAAESFRKLIRQYPAHTTVPQSRFYLGLTLVNLEDFKAARDVLRLYVKDYPKSDDLAEAMYRVGECSFLIDDLKAAETEFQAYLAKFPDDRMGEWAIPYLADTQLRLNDPKSAAESFRKSIDRFPKGMMVEDSKFGLARAYETQEKFDDALRLYQELAANTEGKRAADAQLKIAVHFFDQGQFPEAAAAYDQIPTRFPGSGLVSLSRLNAGYAYYQIQNYAEAIERFNLAERDVKLATTAGFWKGLSLKAAGDFKSAAQTLQAVYERDSQAELSESVLYHWADCELRNGQFAAARKQFLELVERWPAGQFGDSSLHFACESVLQQALAANAEEQPALLNDAQDLMARFAKEYPVSGLRVLQELLQGRLLEARGKAADLETAATVYAKVLRESELPKTQARARFHLGRVRQKLGQHREALETLAPLVVEIRKTETDFEFADALVLQAISLLAEGEYLSASQACETYLGFKIPGEQSAQALSTWAQAEMHLDHSVEANRQLLRLVEEYPGSPLVAYTTHHLAEIAYQNKKWDVSGPLFLTLVAMGKGTPYHSAALSGVAWSDYHNHKFQEAADGFARVVAEYPDDEKLAAEAAYMEGRALQDLGQLEAAAVVYAKALRRFRPSHYAYLSGLQAARVLSKTEKTQAADAAYEELLKLFPQPENLDKLLDEWALLNYEANNFSRADEIFRKLVADVPNSELADNARFSLAESDLIAGKHVAAAKTFRELEADPHSDAKVQEDSLFRLVGIAVDQKRWQEVQDTAKQLLSRFAEGRYLADSQFYLGESQIHLDQLQEAEKTLTALKLRQDDPEVRQAAWFPHIWVILAEAKLRLKKYDDVADLMRDFQAANPEATLAYQLEEVLGRSFKNQAKFPEAREAFERVINSPHGRRTETAAKSQLMIAETYFQQKQYDQALREYLKVYHLYKFPEWQSAALFQAGVCDEQLGHWDSAARIYLELINEFPDSEYARKAAPRLEVARKKTSK